MRENEHIRAEAEKQGVPLWRVAAAMGVCDMTLTRWLRFPLSAEKEAQIMGAIETAAKEG